MNFNLYYNESPGRNLIKNFLNKANPSFIWNDHDQYSNSYNRTDIHDMFDVLGIDYTWTDNEKDSLKFINIGSLPPSSDRYKNILIKASETYDKAVIYSSQEPWQWFHLEDEIKKYPNLIFMDNSVFIEGKQYHEQYKPFPFMMCRMGSMPSNTMLIYPNLSYGMASTKFNCLMYNWRLEKHIAMTYLFVKDMVNNNLITYKKPLPGRVENDNLSHLVTEYFSSYGAYQDPNKGHILKKSVDLLTNINDYKLDEDIRLLPMYTEINSSLRALPKFVYDDTGFSLVVESFSGSVWDIDKNNNAVYKDSQAFITEKTLFPLMNGHPWVTFGDHGFHKSMESFGFRVHDELFDLSFDSEYNALDRINKITDIVEGTSLKNIKEQTTNYHSETHKKIRHNKYQVFNKNSMLWKKLRNQFIRYLQEIKEL